jgi:hypothetical protein
MMEMCVSNICCEGLETSCISFGLYVCISLGMFVSCPIMVEIGECNSHIRNFFQSLMQRTIHFHFENTHFIILCYKKLLYVVCGMVVNLVYFLFL